MPRDAMPCDSRLRPMRSLAARHYGRVTLHPDFVAVAPTIVAANTPPITEIGAVAGRRRREEQSAASRAGAVTIDVADVSDAMADRVPVRIYRPSGGSPRPTVVYAHGGGWVIGSRDTHDPACRRIARDLGVVVVSVEYRVAPEDPFPAAHDDVAAVIAWAAREIAALGGDPMAFGVAGDSSGANLVTAALLSHGPSLDTPVTAQLLLYPVVDRVGEYPSQVENANALQLTWPVMQWFWDRYLGDFADLRDPRHSPLYATNLADLPPTVITSASEDPLRDEAFAYVHALQVAGVAVTHRHHEGLPHGYVLMGAVGAYTEDCISGDVATFGQLLGR